MSLVRRHDSDFFCHSNSKRNVTLDKKWIWNKPLFSWYHLKDLNHHDWHSKQKSNANVVLYSFDHDVRKSWFLQKIDSLKSLVVFFKKFKTKLPRIIGLKSCPFQQKWVEFSHFCNVVQIVFLEALFQLVSRIKLFVQVLQWLRMSTYSWIKKL